MEFLHGGTVREAVKVHKLSSNHSAFIAREVLRGLSYLHSNGWIHRDLKSSNVMLSIRGEIKIVDFGLCCEDTCAKALSKQVGSPYWMAPEIIRDSLHDYKCDIWSLGIICLEMINGNAPYYPYALQALFLAATVGFYHLIPEDAPKPVQEALKAALVVDPKHRASADDLLKMEWLSGQDLDQGISDIFKDIFLANRLNVMASATFG